MGCNPRNTFRKGETVNKLQKTIMRALSTGSGTLPAPQYCLSLDEAQAYCGLHNVRAIVLNRDYSCSITDEGRRIFNRERK